MSTLLYTLARLAQLQGEAVDRVALHEASKAALEGSDTTDAGELASSPSSAPDPRTQLATVCRHLQIKAATWLERPDASVVPALLHHTERGWGILRGQNGQGQWVAEWVDVAAQKWNEGVLDATALQDVTIARVRLQKPFEASNSPVLRLVKEELLANRRMLLDAALGGVVINLIALATSFYSMQVYDRVVPTGASQTLLVLTLSYKISNLP